MTATIQSSISLTPSSRQIGACSGAFSKFPVVPRGKFGARRIGAFGAHTPAWGKKKQKLLIFTILFVGVFAPGHGKKLFLRTFFAPCQGQGKY